jgi:predicted DNA-binding transcriptional regulator AlpA
MIESQYTNDRLLRRDALCELIGGVTYPTIWRWQREAGFPAPVVLNPGAKHPAIAWREREVREWMDSRPVGKGREVPRPHHQAKPEPEPAPEPDVPRKRLHLWDFARRCWDDEAGEG